ncbi:MAG TPA: hypothetical protein VEL76_01330 [Gemmataceae bacterium]|nr:hypothetical protein [Gemmataceae bacterium]
MRYVLSALLMLVPLPRALAQTNEAEKIFRAMEKKIIEAKAFKVTVAIDAKGDTKDRVGRFKGFLLLTSNNKARLKASGVDFGEVRNWEMVSNGKQVKLRPYSLGVSESFKEEATLETPKNLHRHLATRVSQLGVYLNLLRTALLVFGSDDPRSKLDLWGFKEGTAEKVGGRDAKVVRFRVGPRAEKEHAVITVWIDTKTLLPLKRVIVPNLRSVGIIIETYEFTLDPRIEAGAFELAWAQANEAEKLFRAVQEKIKSAKAVQVALNLEIKANGKEGKGKASLLFTKENKARLKMTLDEMGKQLTTEMISDGKQMKFAQSPETIAKAEPEETPASLHQLLTRAVSGPGLSLTSDGLNGFAPPRFSLLAFEAGAAEKVGGRDAKVVSYYVGGLPGADFTVTLWIDAQTSLPLRRLIVPFGGEDDRITEICEFTLNPKIDAGVFQLPK